MTQSHRITELLIQWSDGDQTVLDQLMPLVERELRRLARNFMRKAVNQPILRGNMPFLVREILIRLTVCSWRECGDSD